MCSWAIDRDSNQIYQFGYDPLYRLTDLRQGSSVLEHFDYDATGNRTAATLKSGVRSCFAIFVGLALAYVSSSAH